MKFKKVEIDAFRAFEKKEDGTFDFTVKGDTSKLADLVAIYAPNGFGKTSFYDAVEWAMTNRIARLERGDSKALAKDERANSADMTGRKRTKQYILKNRDSSKNFGSVRISFKEGDSIERETRSLERVGMNDYYYSYNDKNENSYFKDVVLSQEGIDAFLRMDRPEDRYNKFVEYYGNIKEADQLFKNISVLLAENDKRIQENKKELQEVKDEIDRLEIPGDIVEQVNNKIRELKGQSLIDLEALTPLKKDFSSTEFNKLVYLISGKINYLTTSETGLIDQHKNKKGEIAQLLAQLPGYERAQKGIFSCSSEISSINTLLDLFSELDKKKSLRKKKENKLLEVQKRLSVFTQYKERIPKIDVIKKKIDSKNKAITSLTEIRDKDLDAIYQLENELRELNRKVEVISQDLDKEKEKIDGIESKYESYNRNKERKSFLISELESNKKEWRKLNDEKSQAGHKLEKMYQLKRALSHGTVYKEGEQFADSQELYEVLKNCDKTISQLEEEQGILKEKEKSLNSIKDIHGKIVSFGKQYIINTKSNRCPLCNEKEYRDYKELLSRIENENVISQQYEDLSGEIGKKEKEIAEKRNQRSTAITDLVLKIDLKIKNLEENSLTLSTLINEKLRLERDLSHQLDNVNENITLYEKVYKSSDVNVVKGQLENKIEELNTNLHSIEVDISKKKGQLVEAQEKESVTESKINFLHREVGKLKENPDLVEYNTLIDSTPYLHEFDAETVEQHIKEIRIEVDKIEKLIKDYDDEIKQAELDLQDEDEKYLADNLEATEGELAENEKVVVIYENSLKKYFSDSTPHDLDFKLQEKQNEVDAEIIKLESLNNQLNAIDSQLHSIKKLLSLKEKKEKQTALKAEKKRLTSVRNKLEDNKKKLTVYIEALIQDFFEEKLINDIYRRLDPHPDYKDIQFKANLSAKKPELNIYVKKKGDDDVLTPQLFFSSAQVNILSLSIFLARALNVKDNDGKPVDTIFIDDPIQSMDGINLLSVIDLLRTIVLQHKKQVIVSTHDENFFSLLKKKIPPEYYPSKFIEFETFGKVKVSED